jgi:hypothetical protein
MNGLQKINLNNFYEDNSFWVVFLLLENSNTYIYKNCYNKMSIKLSTRQKAILLINYKILLKLLTF